MQRHTRRPLLPVALAGGLLAFAAPVQAQGSDTETIAALRRTVEAQARQMEALLRRMERMEARPPARDPAPAAPRPSPASLQTGLRQAREAADQARAAAAQAQAAQRTAEAARPPPVGVREAVDEGLAGSFPRSVRIPGTDTSIRLYGFVKLDGSFDFSARNQTEAVTAQSIPLSPSTASLQGGDINTTAKRTRLGFETRSDTAWGPARTQVEIDFAGGNPSPSGQATSNGYQPRLRLAFGTVGPLLVGQFNSLWSDDGLYWDEGRFTSLGITRLDNATALGLSAVRQPQVRYTHMFGHGLTFAASVEQPFSDFTSSTDGTLYPTSSPNIAFNQVPDVLARLRYHNDWGIFAVRGMARQIEANLNAPGVSDTQSTIGWGLGAMTSMRTFGRDFVSAQVNYGSGIGRYLDSTSNGQGAVLNQPGNAPAALDTVDVLSVSAGYQWRIADTLRANAYYAYAELRYPAFAAGFSPTGNGARLLNTRLQQGLVNLIWSPLASLDLGIEYMVSTRDLLVPVTVGGLTASQGTSQRLTASAIVHF